MSDFVIVDGDKAYFLPNFGMAIVMVQPGTITGSADATWKNKPMCIEGDETSVEVAGCSYTAGPYAIPGSGTLTINQLNADQVATKTKSKKTAAILKGSQFIAQFEVQSPAQQPTPNGPVPDPTPQYSGQGVFQTTNSHYKGV